MSTLQVSALPCTYTDYGVQINLSVMVAPEYQTRTEVKNLADVATEVAKAQALNAGKNVYLSVSIKAGRKPSGFDKWLATCKKSLYLRAPVAEEIVVTEADFQAVYEHGEQS